MSPDSPSGTGAASNPKVSVCIICRDEEGNIRDCLESVKWADEIVVVDSGSKDRTVEIAKEYTSHVIAHEWTGFNAQRNFSMSRATGEWILCLDADERCTPRLREEIRRILAEQPDAEGFYVRRHTFYLGRWINHCGWYPDWKLRLVRRGRARAVGVEPHDRLQVDGRTARLKGKLQHYTYINFSHHVRTLDRFSDVHRDERLKEGESTGFFPVLVRPWIKFLESYVWKLGFLDGRAGFIVSVTNAFSVFARSVKLWEVDHPSRPDQRADR